MFVIKQLILNSTYKSFFELNGNKIIINDIAGYKKIQVVVEIADILRSNDVSFMVDEYSIINIY